ncbi:MAG TPA: YciI family protein [Candidatus Acidoferrum sp.]
MFASSASGCRFDDASLDARVEAEFGALDNLQNQPQRKESIAGYWIIQVESREEAIEWAKLAPNPAGDGKEGEIEIRQFFGLEDFGPSEADDRAREMSRNLPRKIKQVLISQGLASRGPQQKRE